MASVSNAIVGVMRFSYPAEEGFAVSRLPEAELEALLYDPARLRTRFAYLERIALPSLAAQADDRFVAVILAGRTMPHRFRARLRALEGAHPFLRVLFMERTGALAAAKRAFRRGVEAHADRFGAADHLTGFRIDDDDAVATEFVARLRDGSGRLLASGLAAGPTAIAYGRGLYWDLSDPLQPFHEFRETQPAGQACAMITTSDVPTCVYRYNHRRLACHVPTFMDPAGLMFLRTLHDHNDSGREIPPHARAVTLERARRAIRERFALDPADLEALMPAPPLVARGAP